MSEKSEKNRFLPYIRYLAKRFKIENLESDLLSHLWEIETFKELPSETYTRVCLKNKALTFYKENVSKREDPLDNFEYIPAPVLDIDLRIDIERAFSVLTAFEKDIIFNLFFADISPSIYAKNKGISRQTVYKFRRRAFEKIRCSNCFA